MRADVATCVSTRATGPHLRTALLALLALAALVLSVLAMHSAASVHVMGIPLPVSSSHSAEHELAAAHADMAHIQSADTALVGPATIGTVMVAMTMTTSTTLTMAATHDGMLDCALMVMGCVMLLVVAALILFRRSALIQRLVAAGRTVSCRILAVDAPNDRPRLTVLCISRV